jgi:hypothetical protein
VLLNAVCFLGGAPRGDRQRVFFATAPDATGPYDVGDPVLRPIDGVGELGHATAVLHDGQLLLYFQERVDGGAWGYGLAVGTLPAPVQRLAC